MGIFMGTAIGPSLRVLTGMSATFTIKHLTALAGGPFFLILLRRRRRGEWVE